MVCKPWLTTRWQIRDEDFHSELKCMACKQRAVVGIQEMNAKANDEGKNFYMCKQANKSNRRQ